MGGSSFFYLVLAVACLFAAVYFGWRICSVLVRVVIAVIKALFTGHRDLNPQKTPGRLRLLALALLIAAVIFLYQFRSSLDESGFATAAIVYLVLTIAAGWVAFRSLVKAKRFEAPTATALLSEDQRPPVAYLRSFDDDKKSANAIGIAGLHVNTEEGELADIVKTIGPLIAIGRPGEDLSYFGAARIYVGDGDWHKQVSTLVSKAPLVIVRAGATPGLLWEIKECYRRVSPEKLVVLIPLSKDKYDEFRGNARTVFPCQLPEYDGRRTGYTTIRAILFFDEDWTPHLRPIIQQSTFAYLVIQGLGRVFLPWRESRWTQILGKQSEQRRILERAMEPILQRQAVKPPNAPTKTLQPRVKSPGTKETKHIVGRITKIDRL